MQSKCPRIYADTLAPLPKGADDPLDRFVLLPFLRACLVQLVKVISMTRCFSLSSGTLRNTILLSFIMVVVEVNINIDSIYRWYPPGHGNIFQSMMFNGILDELIGEGRDICFISNIDNTGATIDLTIAKFMANSDVQYLMECTDKTANDSKVFLSLLLLLLFLII